MPSLSKDEIELLKAARELSALLSTDGWKTLRGIIERQIATRQAIVDRPFHDIKHLDGVALDGMTRLAAFEHLKGAILGLRLALDTPQTIVREAEPLRDKTSQPEGA